MRLSGTAVGGGGRGDLRALVVGLAGTARLDECADERQRCGGGEPLGGGEEGDAELLGVGPLLGVEPAGPLDGRAQRPEGVGHLEVAVRAGLQGGDRVARRRRAPGPVTASISTSPSA